MTDDEARITKQAQSPNVSISGFVFLSSFVLSLESFRWQPWDSRLPLGSAKNLGGKSLGQFNEAGMP